jgi:cell division protein FtsB
MAGREVRRRRRRRDTSGGWPSRRLDRIRRRPTEPEQTDDAHATRRPRRQVSTVFGRAWGRLTTRRAALLALVVCALALSVAVPLNTYLSQRNALQAQLQQQEVLRAQLQQLQKREQQLSDPAQVEAEAKSRLRYVLPGQTPYVVQLPGSSPLPSSGLTAPSPGTSASWYQTLWNSIVGTH